jgi:hypothetical protein
MRKFVLFLVPLLFTACFPFDKIPEVKIKIEKSAISSIDSLKILCFDKYSDSQLKDFKVSVDKEEYKFHTNVQNGIIILTLKDKSQFKSKPFKIINFKNRISILKVKEYYIFEKKEESKIVKFSSIILIIFSIVFISKIPIALLIIKPELKINFMLKYGGVNLVYLIVIGILLATFISSFFFFLYPSYLIIMILDLIFLTNCYKESGKFRPVIAGIVSNLLFLTIGQLAITYAMMMAL